jgi:hypothetical protein
MKDEVTAVEQSHVARRHNVVSHLERHQESHRAHHSKDDAALRLDVRSATETDNLMLLTVGGPQQLNLPS